MGSVSAIYLVPMASSSSDVDLSPAQERPATPLDLSKAKTLKEVAFSFEVNHTEWVNATLSTITSGHKDLQQVLIYLSPLVNVRGGLANIRDWAAGLGGEARQELMNLNETLLHLPKLHAIPVKIWSVYSDNDITVMLTDRASVASCELVNFTATRYLL